MDSMTRRFLIAPCYVALIAALAAWSPLAAGQQVAAGSRFVVASGHPEATAVGMHVLRDGGNVIDAAIATSLALGVAEPYGSGLGGKLIMLYREGATGKITSIVALCTSPRELDAESFVELHQSRRQVGYLAAGVPGLLAGLDEAHRRWGSRPWAELVEPAADLAERGVVIHEVMRGMFAAKASSLRQDAEAASIYLRDGQAPPVGARLVNADLAESLRAIALGGADIFYRGPLAREIVSAANTGESPLTYEDFASYEADVSAPLSVDYAGYQVATCPPPLNGGPTVAAALAALEQYEDDAASDDEVAFADRLGRVLQCVYPEVHEAIGDAPPARDAAIRLAGADAAREFASRAAELDPRSPYSSVEVGAAETSADGLPDASTSHLVVIDAAGNMVSLTQSLSLHFGAAVVPPGTGILLNDSMSNFSTHNPASVNHAAGGKRARSTIAPIIVTRDGQPHLALGIPGGQRIPTTTLQLLWRTLHRGQPLAAAFAASRYHLQRPLNARQPPNIVDYESDADPAWVVAMQARGWRMKPRQRNGHYFGGGNAAQYLPDGSLLGVADPRRTNATDAE